MKTRTVYALILISCIVFAFICMQSDSSDNEKEVETVVEHCLYDEIQEVYTEPTEYQKLGFGEEQEPEIVETMIVQNKTEDITLILDTNNKNL